MICPNCQRFSSYTEIKCPFCGCPTSTGLLFNSGRELTVSLGFDSPDCYCPPEPDIHIRVDALAKAFKAKEMEMFGNG